MRHVMASRKTALSLSGRVRSGLGHGAQFTRLEWARKEFIGHCGIDPHPGTLNVVVETTEQRRVWRDIREQGGARVRAPAPDACDAMLYPVSVGRDGGGASLAAAVVVPDVPDYPGDQLEIIAAVNLREHFGIDDGALLGAAFQRPAEVAAVIFDVDGTLVNSLDGYRLAASRATARYGYVVSDADVRRALNTNQPFWDFVIPAGEPKDEQRIAALRAETMRHWPDALAEVVTVLPGVGDTLERLRSAGFRLGIYTGSGGESFPPLRDAGLLDLFEVVVTGHDAPRRKPDPQGIATCLQRLGLEPAAAAYVGDSCIDVGASLAAGVTSIAVLTGAGDSASLSAAGAHRLAADATRVPDLLTPRA
jgi:HAD superfamily hydrolase (TIGR01509 family)